MTRTPEEYVGRNDEVKTFLEILQAPYDNPHSVLLIGPGGIGKTWLIGRLLSEAAKDGTFLVIPEIIDLHATDHRTIDGIQTRLQSLIEAAVTQNTKLEVLQKPFAKYKDRPTPEVFRTCLKEFCSKQPLVVAFDTFERLDAVVGDWLLKGDERALQVPGLVSIVAARPASESIRSDKSYPAPACIMEIEIKGFARGAILDFYNKTRAKVKSPVDISDFLVDSDQKEIDVWLWKRTNGYPLLLEMAINWAPLLDETTLAQTSEEFEKYLMDSLHVKGDIGEFYIRPNKRLTKPEYDTLICMAYIDRRFDDRFLDFLIKNGMLDLCDPQTGREVSRFELLTTLETYFFVKTHYENGQQVMQLHDQMARLIRKYIWDEWCLFSSTRSELPQKLVEFYDILIKETESDEIRDVLEIEELYYQLKVDLDKGGEYWFILAGQQQENINKQLPAEIHRYLDQYPAEVQYDLYAEIARIEFGLRHIKPALENWDKVEALGNLHNRSDWIIDALLGKHNCTWQTDPDRSLYDYVEPAIELARSQVPDKLPMALYEKGFTYSAKLDLEKAIRFYEEAKTAYKGISRKQDEWLANILNDLGYDYARRGEHDKSRSHIDMALSLRKEQLFNAEESMRVFQSSGKHDIEVFRRMQAAFRQRKLEYGMTLNTEAEVTRYKGDARSAASYYNLSLKVFEDLQDPFWQAKAQYSQAEAHRRVALARKKVANLEDYERYMDLAMNNIDASIFLQEKYRIDEDRQTPYRRWGRLLHDRALDFLRTDPKQALKYLDLSKEKLLVALGYATKTNNMLEKLESLVELAFLSDDYLSSGKVLAYEDTYIESLEAAIDAYKAHNPANQWLPIFKNLLEMEKGAFALTAEKNLTKALLFYLDAFKGLAALKGYGMARYVQHYDYLVDVIRNLPDSQVKEEWCQAFIQAWKETIPGQSQSLAELNIEPDLLEFCELELLVI